ncbi:ATP-dependent DNA helicase Q4 [Galendromus occidentalis]|uniref:DNA 3'-5' helicase n=1 Tax=Galendromus occidentalis TaxID=34638 RepID=A0AAJ7SI74_9ACAR|nr:ATP-dependent DNA helicase Q4 [Galendromus occidentalis]
MSVDEACVLSAKLKIKQWEKKFLSVNMRVPEPADIKTAPDDVRASYVLYSKHKKQGQQKEVEAQESRIRKGEVWGSEFNVSQTASPSAQTAQERLAAKMRAQFQPDCSAWKNSLARLRRSAKPAPAKGDPSGDKSDVGAPTELQSVKDPSTTDENGSECSRNTDVPSPVKDRKLSYRPVFRNRDLNPAWLERNANISDAPKSFAVTSPEIVLNTPKENESATFKLSQIKAFSKAVTTTPEVEEAIRLARESTAKENDTGEENCEKPAQKIKSVVTFEEEFSKEMEGRSDVANVRKMKAHQKFAANPKIETLDKSNVDTIDGKAEGAPKVSSSESFESEKTMADEIENGEKRPAPRSILDPFEDHASGRNTDSGSVVQLYPRETVRTAEAQDSEVKKLRKRGGRINAKIDVDLRVKPKRATAKTKSVPRKEPSRKRKREGEIEEDAPETETKYLGAEGPIDDVPSDAKPKAKKPEAYVEDCSGPNRSKRQKVSSLERRMANGTMGENFVKANLRKKTYSRGVKKLNFKKYKFEQWKQAKQSQGGGGGFNPRMNSSECFKCGGFGHWAKYCFAKPKPEQKEDEPAEEIHIPTLDEVAAMVNAGGLVASQAPTYNYNVMPASQTPAEPSHKPVVNDVSVENMDDAQIEELMSNIPEGNPEEDPEVDPARDSISFYEEDEQMEVRKSLRELGFEDFRPGQETVVKRILRGQSTLMVSSTGSGKSLCYQLPAYIFAKRSNCITLVVSPLISLMEDQVTGLPGAFKASYLHSGMAQPQREKALELIREGKVHAVLVSPEAVVAAGQGGSLLSGLPPIAFVCIDEAHCLSEWSHNFRPSYLQLHKTLREKMGVKCVLALTATATKSTCDNISQHLQISSDGVVGLFKLPSNLILTASKEVDRDAALIGLLKSDRFSASSSIIVYTTRRDETERLASLIRTSMQDKLRDPAELAQMKRQRNKTRDVLEWDAEAYHAGLAPAKRKAVQNKFMKGKVRVVVATVAFGMGIDKPDIRAIIHYNMPKSFENYVQEAGRAGRDGKRSDCHLFLEFKSEDRNEIKRHIYTDSTDRFVIRKFLRKVFEPMDRLKDAMNKMPKFEVALDIPQMVEYLDMKEEAILTLMCFLESHPNKFIQIKQKVYGTCTVKCYGGPQQFVSLIKSSPPLAAAVALKKKFGELDKNSSSSLTFPVVEVATFMGWDSKQVKRELKNLEWSNTKGSYRKTGVVVEFSDLCFHLYVSSDLGNLDQDEVLEYLFERTEQQENMQLERLAKVFSAFKHVALESGEGGDEVDIAKSDELKRLIEAYFHEEPLGIEIDEFFNELSTDYDADFVRGDIRSLIHSQPDQTFSGRAVARILHGIPSPNYPAQVWGRLRRVWRSHMEVDFPSLVKIANEEIVSWRTGN